MMSVIMLDRRYTVTQWISLAALGFGVAIVVLGESNHKLKEEKEEGQVEQNLMLGLIAVTISCFCSAFAGVYFEKVLKKPTGDATKPVSMWMRNIQLAFFSICIALGQNVYQAHKSTSKDDNGGKPFLHGFTFWVFVLLFLQAGGGLLIAAIMKYADNVLKGLATGVSVAVSTFLSMMLFGTPLSFQFLRRFVIAAIMKYADNVLKGLATGVSVAVSTFLSMMLFGTPLSFQFLVGAGVILSSVFFFSTGGAKKKGKNDPSSGVELVSTDTKPMMLPK
eukprot:CAMPEP_0195543378 /NCGR_PEP_ID=MMETSP0794_2-20130614/52087_1 /TAXON_ID=515487 /ORGANISM="Stephanopyxis turris, Strain CCMP 815" /LENGTH=277 /DNA_ID=CAMNT_0040677535 /DNA_START=440 /DNA_END=1274 /DNA_ORIENTATION=+